jgi:hypothetical protein
MSGWLHWWEFRKRAHCPHLPLRAIHGDETWYTPGFRRLECRRCGRFLDGPVSLADPQLRAGLIHDMDHQGVPA